MSRKASSEFRASRSWRRTVGSAVTYTGVAILAAACAADPPRTLEQQHSDMSAMKEFYSRLDSDQNYYYPHVTIRVENGVAHLSGYVWNAQALYHAKDVANRVPGVTSVVDTLEVERDGLR